MDEPASGRSLMTAYQDPFLVYMKSTFVLSQPCLALGAIEFSILPETHRFFFEMSEVIDVKVELFKVTFCNKLTFSKS